MSINPIAFAARLLSGPEDQNQKRLDYHELIKVMVIPTNNSPLQEVYIPNQIQRGQTEVTPKMGTFINFYNY
jgi:hypothetical protein